MSAYLIVRTHITDHEQYEKYKLVSSPQEFGGTFVVRGGVHEILEGEPDDRRIVVIEFPSLKSARAFYNSEAYAHAKKVREGAATMEMVLVEGL